MKSLIKSILEVLKVFIRYINKLFTYNNEKKEHCFKNSL